MILLPIAIISFVTYLTFSEPQAEAPTTQEVYHANNADRLK